MQYALCIQAIPEFTKVKVTSYLYNPRTLDFMGHLSRIQGMSMHRKESFTLRGFHLNVSTAPNVTVYMIVSKNNVRGN